MPQDDTTPAGAQAAQPIMPGGSSLVKTGGGAEVNEAGTAPITPATANPAAQPVAIGGSAPVAPPATTSTTAAPGTTDPFAAPAWLQPAPAPVPTTPVPSTDPVSTTAVPAPTINDQAVPVPATEPIDWDAMAKRFGDQSVPTPPPTTSPTDTTATTPTVADAQVAEQGAQVNSSEIPVTPVIPGLDNGLPELPPEMQVDPKPEKKRFGGLQSLLSSFAVDWSVLPWNKHKKEKKEENQGQESVVKPDTVTEDGGIIPITPAELLVASSIPAKPVVQMAGISPANSLPELTGLDGIPNDLFDPNNLIAPSPMIESGSPISTSASSSGGSTRKGPSLVKIFVLLLIVLILGSGALFLVTQVFSPVDILPSDNSNTPQSTPTEGEGGGTPGVVVPNPGGGEVESPTQTERNIYIFLVAYAADQPGGEVDLAGLPTGSVRMGSDYLVRVLTAEEVDTEEPVSASLAKLFSLDKREYLETDYRNLLYNSKLKALVKESANGALLIDLQGEFVVDSDTDYLYAKQQIERTIENYTFNYTLTYNGSEESWRELGISS